MVSYSGQGRLAHRQGDPTFVEYVNCDDDDNDDDDDDDDFGFRILQFTIQEMVLDFAISKVQAAQECQEGK